MVTSDLPEEILIDIFSRLPTKSVGKCRCLAKTWRTLLSTPSFIKSHLARTRKTRQENLILITHSQSIHSIANIKDDDTVSRELELPDLWAEVVGSCDGLVLFINVDDEVILVNPITLQQAKIPTSPLAFERSESFTMHAIGYDSLRDDYKVVVLSYLETYNGSRPSYLDTFVDVYSVKTGVWKRIGISPYPFADLDFAYGVFVNEAIHWLSMNSKLDCPYVLIAAFDLANEVFFEIPAPRGIDVGKFLFKKLVVLGGCLCVVDTSSYSGVDVWIMKEYNVSESWTKFSMYFDQCMFKPLCFIGDDEVVSVVEGPCLVVLNFKDGTSRDLVVNGVPALFTDGCIFVESLVSPAFCGN
ncbi:hypothetical protein DH2020_045027 [Rehmannia glutinosa]|uniref:F-box domain-containing protein n=1 Tax=Rehmannia glutinosa TaxID=99300 RepID=A0ABR0UFC1_REHGL